MYVPVVTLNTENNNKLTKLLSEDLKRSVIWNEYKTITTVGGNTGSKRNILDTSFQGVSRLFLMGFNKNTVKRNRTM